MKRTKYFGLAAGVAFSIGLVAEMCSGVYHDKYNEPLERQLSIEQNRVDELEEHIRTYERRVKCIENNSECEPVRPIEFELLPMFEVTTEGQ